MVTIGKAMGEPLIVGPNDSKQCQTGVPEVKSSNPLLKRDSIAISSTLSYAGNGFPVSALIVTRQLGQEFAKGGMEYFNTFGGGTAACAAALATLRAVKEDGLQAHADEVSEEEIIGFSL